MRGFKTFGLSVLVVLSLSVFMIPFGCSKKSSPAGPSNPTPTPVPGTVNVTTSGMTFSPAAVTISAGQTVHWTNLQGGFHNVVQDDTTTCGSTHSGGFTSGTAGTVDTFDHTFGTAGTYLYECQTHCSGGMKGSVVVQ